MSFFGLGHGFYNSADGTDYQTDQSIEVKKPRMYKVVLFNDNYTTRDFVIDVLVEVFHKDATSATRIMLDVHRKGLGVVGVYTKDIAMSKVEAVHKMARAHDFPLKCAAEPE